MNVSAIVTGILLYAIHLSVRDYIVHERNVQMPVSIVQWSPNNNWADVFFVCVLCDLAISKLGNKYFFGLLNKTTQMPLSVHYTNKFFVRTNILDAINTLYTTADNTANMSSWMI